jgi:hypothetical protein
MAIKVCIFGKGNGFTSDIADLEIAMDNAGKIVIAAKNEATEVAIDFTLQHAKKIADKLYELINSEIESLK